MVQTPLHIAASLNRVEIVRYLLEWKGPGRVELEAKNFVCITDPWETDFFIFGYCSKIRWSIHPSIHICWPICSMVKPHCTRQLRMDAMSQSGCFLITAQTWKPKQMCFTLFIYFLLLYNFHFFSNVIRAWSANWITLSEHDDSTTSCCWLCTSIWRQLDREDIIRVQRWLLSKRRRTYILSR